ncbi:unnamed protein product [Sphagnum troendelagicum]|uniref:Uncharacterized protein n=1 Tax=Sphagnum troendelagicum TaxID=128251 RepID=A0ABP0T7W7_9BRYO
MGPKAYATNKALDGAKELSWMDRMCLKIETYCELGEPGRGPTLLMQEMEMQLNSLGSGLRKLASEANDFVQELLTPPTLSDSDETGEKGVNLKKQANVRFVPGQKKDIIQSTAVPLNFVDEACIEISPNAESCHSGILDFARVEEPSSLHSEGSFEATWDWPQEAFEVSQEAETERWHLEDMGQASCSSAELPEVAPEAFGSVEDESPMDGEGIQTPNEMVEGGEQSAMGLSETEEQNELRQMTMSSSFLDGWEGNDIIVCEETIEPDSWHDWELL